MYIGLGALVLVLVVVGIIYSSGGRRRPFGVPSARVSTTHPAKPLKVVFNNQTSSWRHQKWA